jgi:hypothetical protein
MLIMVALICPTGCFTRSMSRAGRKDISLPSELKSLLSPAPSRAPREGRLAIVTDVGRGMRWTRRRAGRSAHARGRRSRVVLTPRRWRQVAQRYLRDDGGKKARSPGRAWRKPLKPLRGEGRMNPLLPVATTLVCFLFCTRGCGCGGHPVFPAPSLEGRPAPSDGERRKVDAITRAYRAAGTLLAVFCDVNRKSDAFT